MHRPVIDFGGTSSRAICQTPMPCRAITRISTACSWVNIVGGQRAPIIAKAGHFYSDAVGVRQKSSTVYVAMPSLARYSRGLREPRETLIRFSLYQRM